MNEQDREKFREAFVGAVNKSAGKSIEQLENEIIKMHDQLLMIRAGIQGIEAYRAELLRDKERKS